MEIPWNWTHKLQRLGKKPRPETRTIHVGNRVGIDYEVTHEKYPDNRVVSSKYTLWNFLPKNLFEQFRRVANFYFLCVAIIQLSIDSPVSPSTVIVPLVFVVSVTLVKQGYEDYLRHKADRDINNRTFQVLRHGKIKTLKSRAIQVGDIVRCDINDEIPCDLVLLSSSDIRGECYITTANLDGETNLKTYKCVPKTSDFQTAESFNNVNAIIECQQPTADLYRFIGRITFHQANGNSRVTSSLGPENVVLRGSKLRETQFLYGCATYTGTDTKLSLNSQRSGFKFSTVEKSMNKYLVYLLVTVVIQSAVLTGVKRWWYSLDEHSSEREWYRPEESGASVGVIIEEFLSFMVLVNYVIPISLYVTVEFQKFFGSMFFQWDVEMYDKEINEPAKANTSDLNEELGQVEHLFTDKTGTLTQNNLEFRQLSAGGIKYTDHENRLCILPSHPHVKPLPVKHKPSELADLMRVLSLCHTCRVQQIYKKTASSKFLTNEYHASSPDEKALIEACKRYGVEYLGMMNGRADVDFDGEIEQYIIHHILCFDPVRRRMSVIVEDSEGNIYLMVKGAETAVLERCIHGDIDIIEKHVIQFALLGLRTLCIAQRKLSLEEFLEIDAMLKEAQNSLENRDEKLARAYDEIETRLTILGATGVEDKLQEGVPQTIRALREAGIKVWVLTGDKEETAVNISFSAGHINQDMVMLSLTKQPTWQQCEATLASIHRKVSDLRSGSFSRQCALVIDGPSLAVCLRHGKDLLQQLCSKVSAVLGCRLSPLQKAQVVTMVKHTKEKPITAAIGDGANDVSMIQEAHVGLGIMGKEGRQASLCSDYAFGQFRFLQRALLVHGHYFYWRISRLVQFCFYKNVAFITANIYFAIFSAFSAQSIYESMQLTMYNTLYTQLAILVYGIYEKHISTEQLLKRPRLYRLISGNAQMSINQFLLWYITGLYQSLVCFFGCFAMFYWQSAWNSTGQMYGLFSFGSLLYTSVIFSANIKLMLNWYYWTWLTFGVFAVVLGSFYATMWVYTSIPWPWLKRFIPNYDMYGVILQHCGDGSTWLLMLLIVTAAVLPDIVIRALRDTFSVAYKYKPAKKEKNKLTSSRERITEDSCSVSYRSSFTVGRFSSCLPACMCCRKQDSDASLELPTIYFLPTSDESTFL